MKEKILKLLGNGLTPSMVASAVGCQPSYISQLMSDTQFATEVAQLRCHQLEEASDRDAKYDRLEDALLEKLEDLLPIMLKPRDVLDALTRINAAKRRGTTLLTTEQPVINQVINLHLPTVVLKNYQAVANEQNEIVEVGGRALVNMPATTLMKSLEDRSTREQTPIPKITVSHKQAERAVITEDSV